ncbi:tRNA-guanine transglycosylase DpdA, partial [Vibrio diabolicus]
MLELLECLIEVREPDTEFHLLGICRFENIPAYVKAGVTSADSTSPLMQGLKGGKYYTLGENEQKFQESLVVRVRQCDHDTVQKHI